MENSDLVAGETKVKTAFTTCMVVISLWVSLGFLGSKHFLFLDVALASRMTILGDPGAWCVGSTTENYEREF